MTKPPFTAFTNAMGRFSTTTWALLGAWVLLVGGYSIASLIVPGGRGLTAFGDIGQCLAALFATVGLLMNAFCPQKRTRAFWLLLALGCGAWLVGQVTWTYFEVVLRKNVPNPFLGVVVLFLHSVPMMVSASRSPRRVKRAHRLSAFFAFAGLVGVPLPFCGDPLAVRGAQRTRVRLDV